VNQSGIEIGTVACARPRAQQLPLGPARPGSQGRFDVRKLLRPGTGALRHFCGLRLGPKLAALCGLAFIMAATPARSEEFLLSRWLQPVPRHSVLAEPGYYVWGGSVIEDGGQYHMFYARWPTNTYSFADGWLFNSEICHAVAATPDGPFTPTGVVLGKRAADPNMSYWDSQTQENPHIRNRGEARVTVTTISHPAAASYSLAALWFVIAIRSPVFLNCRGLKWQNGCNSSPGCSSAC